MATDATVPSVDLVMLNTVFKHMAGRVTYELGAKAPNLTCDSHEIQHIDCSGFVRYILARATDGKLQLPDGSQNQLDWAKKHLRPVPYDDVFERQSKLYIAFLSPDPGDDWPRHVWLVRQGWTRESCSSQGVTARPAGHPCLEHNRSGCFVLPSHK